MIYRRTTTEAFLELGSVQLRASVAADGDQDRAQIRVLRHNHGSHTFDEIWMSPTVVELGEFVGVLTNLARENRGKDAE